MKQKDKINRGDDATAFNKSPIKIILEYDSPYVITRADFVVNGGVLVKKYMNPTFPLEVVLDTKDTAKLEYKNIGKLVVWDARGRRETSVGALFFCTDPDVYDTGKYSVTPEDLNCKCTCHDGVYHAIFTVNATPEKVSELINDLEFQTKQEVNSAIQVVDEKVDTEVDRLDDRIDNILIDVDDIVQAEADARKEADNILDAKIDSEADRLENLIQSESDSINTRIDNEVSQLEEEIEQSKSIIQGSDLIEATTVNQTTTLVSKSFIFIQAIASDVWVIEHNLNKRPSITSVDSAGSVQIPDDITYNSDNKVTVKFLSSFSGKAYLN